MNDHRMCGRCLEDENSSLTYKQGIVHVKVFRKAGICRVTTMWHSKTIFSSASGWKECPEFYHIKTVFDKDNGILHYDYDVLLS
jgi:hypothetical protein